MITQKLFTTIALACCLFISSESAAQTTINAASNSAIINGLRLDYSIGEMTLVSTEKTNNLIVTQGFLQPSTVGQDANNSQTSGLDNFASLLQVYPNPTDNILFIESKTAFGNSFNFQLIDASGKTVISKSKASEISNQKFSINLSALAAGSYFLLVQQQGVTGIMQNTSFKIQKTN